MVYTASCINPDLESYTTILLDKHLLYYLSHYRIPMTKWQWTIKSNIPLTPYIQTANPAFVIMPPLLDGGGKDSGRQTIDRTNGQWSTVYGLSSSSPTEEQPYDAI